MASSVSNLKIHDFDEDLNALNKFGSCKVIDKVGTIEGVLQENPPFEHITKSL